MSGLGKRRKVGECRPAVTRTETVIGTATEKWTETESGIEKERETVTEEGTGTESVIETERETAAETGNVSGTEKETEMDHSDVSRCTLWAAVSVNNFNFNLASHTCFF